jgi:hypothetical protein
MSRRKDEKTGRVLAGFDANRSPRLPDEGPDGRWDVSAHLDRESLAVIETDGSEELGRQGWLPPVLENLKKEQVEALKEASHGKA